MSSVRGCAGMARHSGSLDAFDDRTADEQARWLCLAVSFEVLRAISRSTPRPRRSASFPARRCLRTCFQNVPGSCEPSDSSGVILVVRDVVFGSEDAAGISARLGAFTEVLFCAMTSESFSSIPIRPESDAVHRPRNPIRRGQAYGWGICIDTSRMPASTSTVLGTVPQQQHLIACSVIQRAAYADPIKRAGLAGRTLGGMGTAGKIRTRTAAGG